MTDARHSLPRLFATDLDGTLLDEMTYAFDPARPALDAISAGGVPLVLASSKTRREMETVATALGVDCVLIVENGGAIILPATQPSGDCWASSSGAQEVVLGADRNTLIEQLAEMARETSATVRGFSALPIEEIARLTGLGPVEARAAADRQYDEPFLLDEVEALPALVAAATARGLRVTRGGRFNHLTGPSDKGSALRALLARWAGEGRRYSTVGLGDSPNDVPLLQAVDRPIVVPRPSGLPDEALVAEVRGAEIAPHPGPAGWNLAVLAVMAGRRLPFAPGVTV